MKIGMNIPIMVPGVDRDRMLAWCEAIDAGPWSSLAVGERINFPNAAPLVTLATAAAVTKRVRIMSYVLIVPMHSEVLLAKELATLDIVSGGRLSVGVGAGAREEDYAAAGRPFGKRRLSQLRDQVATMRRVWKGEYVAEGALRPVEPLPVQDGGPEVLVAALSDKAIRHAAAWADGLAGFSFGPSVDDLNRVFGAARSAWKEHARESSPRLVASFWYALGSDTRAQLDDYLHRYLEFMGGDLAKTLASTVSTDSPQKLADAMKQIEDTGADEVSLVPTSWDVDEVARAADALGL